MIKYESCYSSGICNICHDLVNQTICEKITSKFTGRVIAHTKINNAERSSAHLVHRHCLELWRNTGHQSCPECRLQVEIVAPSLSEIFSPALMIRRVRQIDLTYILLRAMCNEVTLAGAIHGVCVFGQMPFAIPGIIIMDLTGHFREPLVKHPIFIPMMMVSHAITGVVIKKWMEGVERKYILGVMGAVLGSCTGYSWQASDHFRRDFATFMSINTATSYIGYRIGKLASRWI